jgi:hypothetical protein
MLKKEEEGKQRNKRKRRKSRNSILELSAVFLPDGVTWKALRQFAGCQENH